MTDDERERVLRRELHAVLKSLSVGREPIDLVGDISVVEDFVGDLAQARIADARAAGASWADISERLGVTRQAVHKRFGGQSKRKRGSARSSSCASRSTGKSGHEQARKAAEARP
jgi:hypothetical protein